MKSLYTIFFGFFFVVGCTSNNDIKLPDTKTAIVSLSEKGDTNNLFLNPILIYGSSFGQYFQSLIKTSKFDVMLQFTSSKTIEKYGSDKLLKMYKQLDFAYPLKLKNSKQIQNGDTELTYETTIMATNKIFRMYVRVENDTTKLVSCTLKGFPEVDE